MKYFTKEWCFGEIHDEQIEENLSLYKEYINKVYHSLPFALKILSKHIPLHDGIINLIEYSEKKLALYGIFGDLEIGYFNLKITYEKISKNININWLESNFQNKNIEILSDELEILDSNNYSHKLLFSSKEELEIMFQNVILEINNTKKESYQKKPCKLVRVN